MKIFRIVRDNFDCNSNKYYFVNNNSIMMLYQSLNCDLVFNIKSYNNEKESSFLIKKEEYPKVYLLIKEMLDNIEKEKYLRNMDIISPEYRELYERGYFSWKSDAPANELNEKSEFIYNYFNILIFEDYVEFRFINNINMQRYTVEVNTDRSRYGKFRFEVFDFFKNLECVCEQTDSKDVIVQLRQMLMKK